MTRAICRATGEVAPATTGMSAVATEYSVPCEATTR